MTKLLERHLELLQAANNAKTKRERLFALTRLDGFRAALELLEPPVTSHLIECDMFYMNKGIDRPMCCGVWLDWKPTKA